MDKTTLRKMVALIKKYNPKARGHIYVKSSDNGILLIVRGQQARYMSNALYHLMRALGRRHVRRWPCGSDWCVAFS
jgi:hypothetical protein